MASEKIMRLDLDPARAPQVVQELAQAPIHEVIDLVERSSASRAALILRLLARSRAIDVFDALDPAHQADLIGALQSKETYDFFEDMDPDDRVSLLDELPAEIAEQLLRNLDATERDITGVVLGYPRGSVGRRMSPEVPTIYADMTAGEALAELRRQAHDVETIYLIPITNRDRTLVGACSLRTVFTAAPQTPLSDLMAEPVYANAHDDAEETARWFLPLDYLAIPIVDDSTRLVGILTFDDAADIAEEAESEDSARAGGAEPLQQPYLSTPLLKLVRSRVVWLLVLAVSALLTVKVLDAFEATLSQAVVLSLFIPLLTGTGGNTGNQAATTVTRSLALGDVRKRDVARVMWREFRVGLTLGALLGALGFTLATLVYGLPIGMVIGLTMLAVCTMSATVGGAMPIIAKTVGADPAVFSNPFISTFCDATGLVVYFCIAKAILGL
ncbi:magnesium transporter [Corynebacterium sp. zg-331]|uniref:magnesium transporter n=1 Tax=unclassified Corynebacterium TaxID=2624378 RepID=UPI00128CFFD7|nr:MULTISPECIES: magnesium transporter [unclassified Corynebacterium]MBC3186621.1 magnesium transporter [Corynebacterium sp. zg-331]MPV53105.1 magnesium transporter [Corynebacterium sp. zg331]